MEKDLTFYQSSRWEVWWCGRRPKIEACSSENIVKIDQLDLDSSNEFSTTLVAGGPLWKAGGDYTVKANYGAQKAETTNEKS